MHIMDRLRKIERHISTPHHPVADGAEIAREETYNTHTTNVYSNSNRENHGKEGSSNEGSGEVADDMGR